MVLAVGLFALGLAVYGGDDGSESSAESRAKEAFLERAEAICLRYNDRIADLDARSGRDAKAAMLLDELFPLVRWELAELRDLDPPEADAAPIEAMWDEREKGLDEIEQALRQRRPGDQLPYQIVDFSVAPYGDQMDFAIKYGFDACLGS